MNVSTIIFADHDDPDIKYIAGERRKQGWLWLPLGLRTADYDIAVSSQSSWIRCGQLHISDAEIDNAARIVFRRWKVSPPTPAVRLDSDDAIGQFMLREWSSAIETLMARWYRRDHLKWSRRPTDDNPKHDLLTQISSIVSVPEFVISTTPTPVAAQMVSKTISTNQHFDERTRASTIIVEGGTRSPLFKYRQPCPTLVQHRIDAETEIRLSFSFGSIAAVAQRNQNGQPVDSRFATQFQRSSLPAHDVLSAQARAVAETLGLQVYTADVLVDRAGQHWWIDVNPDGLHIAADSTSGGLTSNLRTGISATPISRRS